MTQEQEEGYTPGDLHVARYAAGLSLSDLAELAGVQERAVRRWLSGAKPVPPDLMDALHLILDDIGVIADRAVAAYEESGQTDVVLVTYDRNQDIRRYGQPMPARGHADGPFAGAHTEAVAQAADAIREAGGSVHLVLFDEESFTAWLLENDRALDGSAVAEWGTGQLEECPVTPWTNPPLDPG